MEDKNKSSCLVGKSKAERIGQDGSGGGVGGEEMTILIAILTVALIISLVKQFLYRSALTGVLYHILNEYNIELGLEKVKELQIKAGIRLILEFFHRK